LIEVPEDQFGSIADLVLLVLEDVRTGVTKRLVRREANSVQEAKHFGLIRRKATEKSTWSLCAFSENKVYIRNDSS
jgi:hypothetical protein